MWPRYVEGLLGLWLLATPTIYGHAAHFPILATAERAAGAAVVLAAILSWWKATARAHFATGVIALLLGGYAYFSFPRPGPPPTQNDITVAVILLTFCL